MTKRIFIAFAIAAALVSCTKEPTNNNESINPGKGKLIVRASAPKTKLVFTDNGADGYSLTFQDHTDHLWGYFRNGSSIVNYITTSDQEKNRMFMELDEGTLSLDRKTASFTSDCKIIPADATNIFFYLDNNVTPISYNSTPTFCDLHAQSGALADANLLHVIVGSTDIASMSTDSNGDKIANITFAYKTSVIKLDITFPDGIVPTADENTVLTLTDDDVYNKVHVSWGEPGASSEQGAITFHPASVSGQVATAYITVWEGSTFSDATLTGVVDGAVCRVTVNAASAIAAGKVYHMARTLDLTDFDNLDKWVNDNAGSLTYMKNETVSSKPAWVAYNPTTGAVSWEANATGAPRKGAVVFDSGREVQLTQLEVKDFEGDWTVKMGGYHRETTTGGSFAKAAAASGSVQTYGGGSNDAKAKDNYYDDTWRAPSGNTNVTWNLAFSDTGDETFLGEGYSNLKEANKKPNNYTITGIYRNLTMAARAEVNYARKWARFYLYLDTTVQTIVGGIFDGQYGAIVTELMKSGRYELGTAHGGNGYIFGAAANSTGYNGNVTVTDGGLSISITELQNCPAYYSGGNPWLIKGLMVTRLATTTNNAANLVRSPLSSWAYSNMSQGGAAYAAVYQGTFTLTK